MRYRPTFPKSLSRNLKMKSNRPALKFNNEMSDSDFTRIGIMEAGYGSSLHFPAEPG